MNTKCLIIEEAEYTSSELSRIINQLRPDYDIVKVAEGISEAVEYMKTEHIDLIIADADVCDGNTVKLFKKNNIHNPFILLASQYRNDIDLDGMNVVDYIFLPPEIHSLAKALNNYSSQMESKRYKKNNNTKTESL